MTFRKQAPKPHPDWFWSMSGGVDSTASFLLTKDAIEQNYQKSGVMLYFDTGVGAEVNRIYLELLADTYGVQLWTLRTNYPFADWVKTEGCPGPAAHRFVRNALKGRQASKINTVAGNPIHIIGIRGEESPVRSRMARAEVKTKHIEVRPVIDLTKKQCAEIILRHPECPINPCWLWNHASDCFCLANGDPSELDAMAEKFPYFAQRLREIEEAANAEGVESLLGWGGLSAVEKDAIEAGEEQMALCSTECSRSNPPEFADAFRARLNGATPEEAIEILHTDDPGDFDVGIGE